jgi:hypothetical protein
MTSPHHIIIISRVGRYWKPTRFGRRPSDDGILAMLKIAKHNIIYYYIIRLALSQDLGPVCIPGTNKITVPGCVWPHASISLCVLF